MSGRSSLCACRQGPNNPVLCWSTAAVTLSFFGSDLIPRVFDSLLGLLEASFHSPKRALADPAPDGNSGEAFFQLIKLCFCQIFKRQQLVTGSFAHPDQLIQFKLNRSTVAVLRVLD
jgi:hypothetical protein